MTGALLVTSLFVACLAHQARASGPSFVDVDGGRLAYESCSPKGATQNIILIHDGIFDSAVWNGVWPILCETFHTVRFDERGYGNSPQSTQPYSSTDDIANLMAALHIKRATLVGASANGGRAIALALDHPETVDSLIVSGPAVPGIPYSEEFIRLLMPFAEHRMKSEVPGAISAVEQIPYIVAPGNHRARREAIALLRDHPEDLRLRPLEKEDESIVARLGELKVRTLIIVGDSDHANNLNEARIAHEKIPRSALVTIRNAGHLPYLEHPSEFAELVISFVKNR
jgi:3-oxoadipate enol-lactonase